MAKKKIVSRCYCGKKLRKKAKRCQRCDRMTRRGMEASLRKAAASGAGPAVVQKAATATVTCRCGRENDRRRGPLCAGCTKLLPGVPVPHLDQAAKSAFAAGFWEREYGSSPDPAIREMVRKARYGEQGGPA